MNDVKDPEGKTTQQQSCNGAADDAVGAAEEHGTNIDRMPCRQLDAGGGGAHTVHAIGGHDTGEGNQQKASCRQGGVDKVFSQTAEGAFHHENGENGTEDRHIEGRLRRKRQSQQQTCNGGGAVLPTVGSSGQLVENQFRQHCGDDRTQDDPESVQPEGDASGCGRR